MTVEDRGTAADCDEARRKERGRLSARFAGRTAIGLRLNRGLRATISGVRAASTKVAAGASTASKATANSVRAASTKVAAGASTASKATANSVRAASTGVAAGGSTAGRALKDFAENLNWNTIDRTKYMRAGTRGASRSADEARRVWESIPKSLRAQGNDEVLKWLRDFDWSHKRPHSQGGGTEASNGIFEARSLNRSRGARRMTGEEIKNAEKVLSNEGLRSGLRNTVRSTRKAAIKGSGVACAFAIFEHGLEYRKGEITRKEMCKRIGKSAMSEGAIAVVIAGGIVIVGASSGPVTPVAAILMKSLAVLGYTQSASRAIKLGKGWFDELELADQLTRIRGDAIKLGKGWFDELRKSDDSDENSRYAPSEFPLHVPTEFTMQAPSELPLQALSEFLESDETSSADGELRVVFRNRICNNTIQFIRSSADGELRVVFKDPGFGLEPSSADGEFTDPDNQGDA